jgi:hypothetical protein
MPPKFASYVVVLMLLKTRGKLFHLVSELALWSRNCIRFLEYRILYRLQTIHETNENDYIQHIRRSACDTLLIEV